jgi:hypothetical protein
MFQMHLKEVKTRLRTIYNEAQYVCDVIHHTLTQSLHSIMVVEVSLA